jgi:uncharacterized protein YdhG (YjbR/CyaY superfamily)
MSKMREAHTTIDEYIRSFPVPVQKKLMELRKTVAAAAPGAQEKISYSMPSFFFHGVLVYFAAYEHHIGFYPTASGIKAYRTALSKYETAKGTVRFPIDKPLPLGLIKRIVRFRVQENLKKITDKSRKLQ